MKSSPWRPGAEKGRATPAGFYDALIGGEWNLPADRELAEKALKVIPTIKHGAITSRAFLRRAVHHFAQEGYDQFLDLGSGIPATGNVHEIAQINRPGARVVYVDNHAVAVMTGQQILRDNPDAVSILGDARNPEAVLGDEELNKTIDLDRPVVLLAVALLHYLTDEDHPYEVMAQLRDRLAPGSVLVLTHGASESYAPSQAQQVQAAFAASEASKPVTRNYDEVLRFFGDFEMIDPGLVWLPQWRPSPDDPQWFVSDPVRSGALAGAALKR
ncbi:S-adenosyl methyltransferase [Micromonospora sp. MW-13]|uniref:SAM-dependent methyltransferase n=1 Tax=Micromonospora sp. MW-13 TaxID=2094022 RepID=UPI000E43902D|nr:SAM-dependent methyltransferase [Micromonospora sp. MW-13]RGC68566.1 S-adenosyl methyltransferase [Micromonospora sp. MW-13]